MTTHHTWWTATITAPDGTRTEPYCAMEPVTRAQALDRLLATMRLPHQRTGYVYR